MGSRSPTAPPARSLLVALGVSLLSVPGTAASVRAQLGPAAEAVVRERPVPDYDSRAEPPPSAGDKLLWIPRVLLAPLYLVSEYLIRRPIVAIARPLAEMRAAEYLWDLLHFGPGERIRLLPTFLYEFGFRPSVGLRLRWQELGHAGHTLRAAVAFGGRDWIKGALGSELAVAGSPWSFSLGGSVRRRPDHKFFGIGSSSSEANESRYSQLGVDATFGAAARLGAVVELALETGYRYREFGTDVGGDTSVLDLLEPGEVPDATITQAPPGFMEGYSAWRGRAEVAVDTRAERLAPPTWLDAYGWVELAFDLRAGPDESAWFLYGAGLAGYVDVSGVRHVLGLDLDVALAEDLRGATPFTELPRLSGNGPMPGLQGNRLIGPSAAAASFSYQWPVWQQTDGLVRLSVGNVFDGRFEDFDLRRLRLSFAAGIAVVDGGERSFHALAGFGTETFEDGTSVEQVRVSIGTSTDM